MPLTLSIFVKFDCVNNLCRWSQTSFAVSYFANCVPMEFSTELLIQVIIFALFASHVSIKTTSPLNILRYHISSTNIPPHLLTIEKISHYITLVWIILSIQPHTHRLKQIISFGSYN
jgi:hypothetical protein